LETVDPHCLYIKTDDESADTINEAVTLYSTYSDNLHFLGNVDPTTTLTEIFSENDGLVIYRMYGNQDTTIYPVEVPTPTQSNNVAVVTLHKSGGVGRFTFTFDDEMYICHVYTSSAQGGYTVTPWEKLGEGDDSGWQTLPLNSNVATTVSTATTPKYRKIGKQVFIEGEVKLTFNATYDFTTEFANIPEGYRPSKYFDAQMHIAASAFPQAISFMSVSTNGKMLVDYIWDLTHNQNLTSCSNAYAYIHLNYLVD
jgi:hypothetical protein